MNTSAVFQLLFEHLNLIFFHLEQFNYQQNVGFRAQTKKQFIFIGRIWKRRCRD